MPQPATTGFAPLTCRLLVATIAIAALLTSPVFAVGDCGVHITSGTGVLGTPVVFSGLGGLPDGRFFLLGAGDLYNSGTLPPSVWLVNLGDLDGDGQPEYRIEVPTDGAGSWNDPRAVGCPGELGSKPPLVLLLHAIPEDLDKDGDFDVFEDTLHRNGILDVGEDRDGDGRLTPSGSPGNPGGCEGVGREDIDCDGRLDVVDEDPNGNGVCDPGEPLFPNCDVDHDGHLDRGIEDRNGNGILDDRPFPKLTDSVGLYPYGSAKPTPGGVIVASVAWNGTAYDFDTINTPTRTIVAGDGTTYRIVDAATTPNVRARVTGARQMSFDAAAGLAVWRFGMVAPAIPLADDVGGTRTIFNLREFWNIRTNTLLAPKAPQPDGSAVAFTTLVVPTGVNPTKDYPLSALSALPLSAGSTALLHADIALYGALETPLPFDADGDGHRLPLDNCPDLSNPLWDIDRDGIGDSCDQTPPTDGQWTSLSPAMTPGLRSRSAAVYDPIGARVIVYGGSFDTQTWAYDGVNWTPLATIGNPGARAGHGMVYDDLHHRILLFGGARDADHVELNDLWSFDGVQWTNITPPSSPSPRQDLGLAFDSARGLLVLFGGIHRGLALADTWAYDGVEWRFMPSASGPAARYRMQMAYDPVRTVTVLMGGAGVSSTFTPFYNDTWQFDGTRWVLVDYLGNVPPTWNGGMVYDPGSRQMILFGGNDQTLVNVYFYPTSSATRVFDGGTWRTLSTLDVPVPGCDPPVLAFDPVRGVLVYYDSCYGQFELRRPPDLDGDGIANGGDNCPLVANPGQEDVDHDGVGDACDNCVAIPNVSQQNLDGDPYGDACDYCVLDPNDAHVDSDGDGLGDVCDCRPLDPASGLPPEVGDTVAVQQAAPGAATTIAWNADGATAQYDTYVGTIPAGMMGSRPSPYDYRCLQGNLSPSGGSVSASDASEPAVGTARYYLMSGENGCGEGTLGASSTGQPRPAPYACGLPHPTPPIIDDVQVGFAINVASCPEYDTVFRARVCDFGITPDMYTLSPGPSIQVQSIHTDATFQVHAFTPDSSGLNAGGLSVLALSPVMQGGVPSLSILDDGSQFITPVVANNLENCFADPATGTCGCTGAVTFSTSSHDPIAGDQFFTRTFVPRPPSLPPLSAAATLLALDCLYLRTQATQVILDPPPGSPALFTIDAYDSAGYVTTWPTPLPITIQTPTLDCSGDDCLCCIFTTNDPGTQCRGLTGMLGVPGTGFETGFCKSL